MWKTGFLCAGMLVAAARLPAAEPPTAALQPVPEAAASAPVLLPDAEAAPMAAVHHHPRLWKDRIKPWLQYRSWGYADEFEETPHGAALHAVISTQVCNGLLAQMSLFRGDFTPAPLEAQRLTPQGSRRLDQMVTMMQTLDFTEIKIEPSGDAQLDAARKSLVLKLLAQRNFAVPEQAVVIARPPVPGLDPVEAGMIHQSMLNDTAQGGPQRTGAGAVSFGGSDARMEEQSIQRSDQKVDQKVDQTVR